MSTKQTRTRLQRTGNNLLKVSLNNWQTSASLTIFWKRNSTFKQLMRISVFKITHWQDKWSKTVAAHKMKATQAQRVTSIHSVTSKSHWYKEVIEMSLWSIFLLSSYIVQRVKLRKQSKCLSKWKRSLGPVTKMRSMGKGSIWWWKYSMSCPHVEPMQDQILRTKAWWNLALSLQNISSVR